MLNSLTKTVSQIRYVPLIFNPDPSVVKSTKAVEHL